MLKLAVLALLLGAPLFQAFACLQDSGLSTKFTDAAAPPSHAEQRIVAARRQLAKDPKHSQAYTDLTLACIRRARETGDPDWYQKAETALADGFRVTGRLPIAEGRRRSAVSSSAIPGSADRSAQAECKNMDDVKVYGYMGEADIALGKYADAGTAAQWMLDMRPNNLAGPLLGAELRVIYGDAPGALEFLHLAFGETPQIESEELASIANRIAMVELDSGQTERAAQTLARAQQLFPQSPVTQQNVARLRLAQHKPDQAIASLEQRLASETTMHAPEARTLFLLALAYKDAGKTGTSFIQFVETARAETINPTNDNVDLIEYDASLPGEAAQNAAEALSIAQHEIATRQDVSTIDAYAWARSMPTAGTPRQRHRSTERSPSAYAARG